MREWTILWRLFVVRARKIYIALVCMGSLMIQIVVMLLALQISVSCLAVELEPVLAEGALALELDKYGMTAWQTECDGLRFSCLAYTPTSKGKKPLPLLVYIPGRGEIGEDLLHQFNQRRLFDLVTSAGFQAKHPCHLLAISPPKAVTTLMGGGVGRPSRVQQMLRALVSWMETNAKKPGIDSSRIYLCGFSYGGNGVYALANHYPGEFAAVVPISAICPHVEYVCKDAPGNWWHMYNESDFRGCESMFDDLCAFKNRVNELGGDFRMGTYPMAGHDAWTKTWRENALWDWVFSKSTIPKPMRWRRAAEAMVPLPLANSTCEASIPGKDAAHGPERAVDGLNATAYVAARRFERSDWWRIDFQIPLTGRVEVVLGDESGKTLPVGVVIEVTQDGRTWKRIAFQRDKDRVCTLMLRDKTKSLRIKTRSRTPVPFALRMVSVFPLRP